VAFTQQSSSIAATLPPWVSAVTALATALAEARDACDRATEEARAATSRAAAAEARAAAAEARLASATAAAAREATADAARGAAATRATIQSLERSLTDLRDAVRARDRRIATLEAGRVALSARVRWGATAQRPECEVGPAAPGSPLLEASELRLGSGEAAAAAARPRRWMPATPARPRSASAAPRRALAHPNLNGPG
jgi:hypothetical protein